MKFVNLFNGLFYNFLGKKSKNDVDKEYTNWLKEMFSFLVVGIIFGIVVGILMCKN